MTWKDYVLVLATQVVIALALFLGVGWYVEARYPNMTGYVKLVAQELQGKIQPWAQEMDRRVKALETASTAKPGAKP